MPTQSKPVVPWIGGKRRLAKHILPLFPEHVCYCEPFCSAAALFFLKAPSKVEVVNDINGELINFYRVIQHHLEEFVRQFRWSLVSRQMYIWLQMQPAEPLTDIQRAARFFYLQKMGFGGKVVGQTFGISATSPPRLNLLRIEQDLSDAHLRLARVLIEHLGWETCVIKYDRADTLFYFDPPYWQTEGYGVEFGLDQYKRLAAAMRGMFGKAVLSINKHPDIEMVFADFPYREVAIDYTVGGSGRGAKRTELIISNF